MNLIKRIIRWLIVLGVLGAVGVVGYRYVDGANATPLEYSTVMVGRGRIVEEVTATGTLSSLVTVQVGSQVSGRIEALYVDFNSSVEEGQVLAQIDQQAFDASLEQANANYAVARAQVAEAEASARDAERQAERLRTLANRSLVAAAEAESAESVAEVAQARIESAEAGVRQARAARDARRVDLEYTTIVSPISGTVISRDVDVGQTVAASLSAPTLFVIAEDLRHMQVDTYVAEADIGVLYDGMTATFSVDAYPDDEFEGTVRQIRYEATTQQNVVTYDVIVDVGNDELKLRPGMTANVTFVVEERNDVLRLPNTVLRFRAPEELSCQPSGRPAGAPPDGAPPGARPTSADAAEGVEGSGGGVEDGLVRSPRDDMPDGATGRRMIYVLRDGTPTCVHVLLGLTDGSYTEVLRGDLAEGDEVIIDSVGGTVSVEDDSREQGRSRRGPPGML